MAKVNKSLSLPVNVAERLEDEDNQSEKVEALLREDYGLHDNDAVESDT